MSQDFARQTGTVGTAISGVGAAGGTATSGTVLFSNSNNVSFGMAGQTITATATVSQSVQTQNLIDVTLAGNTAGALALVSSGTLTLAGGNNITLSQAGNAITISGPAAAGAQTAISGIAASNTTYTSGTVSFTGVGGGVTVSSNTGQRVDISVATPVPIGTSINPVASASSVGTVTRYAPEDHRHEGIFSAGVSTGGNTVGTTSVGPGRLVLAGGTNITLSQATAAGALMTVTVSGTGPVTLSTYYMPASGGSSTSYGNLATNTSASVFFMPYVVPDYVSVGCMDIFGSASFVTVGTSSGQETFGLAFGLYTRPTNSNSTRLESYATQSVSWGVTGNNSSYTINQPTSTAFSGYGTGATNSAGVDITSGYTGFKIIQFPLNTLLTPGVYWLGYIGTNSTSSNNVGLSLSLQGVLTGPTGMTAGAPMGSFSTAYSTGADPVGGRWHIGQGSWTSVGSVTMIPVSAAFASISAGDVRSIPILRFWST